MKSNGTPPPAPHVVAIDDNARWLFPLERAPPSPLEGCLNCGENGDPAHSTSNGSPPTPSPPSKSSQSPSNVLTSFPTLVTMGGIAPVDACPPPAVLTEWRIYAGHDSPGGPTMVNIRSGEKLWPPPASVWDLIEWDIVYSPRPKGTWYRVPESRRWVHLDFITSWIHLPTKYEWYLVEDTARPVSARPSLPHQIELILAKFTLRRMILPKRGGDATPVSSGRSFSPTLPHPKSYVSALLSTLGGDRQPSSHVLQSTMATMSAAIMLIQTARRRKRPRRRPGRRNGPRAPNSPNEATPSHPVPTTMGGTIMPTTNHLLSARATVICRSTVSPSAQPFVTHHRTGDVVSTRGRNDFFRDCDELPRKRPRRRPHARRVCRRHGPRDPNPTGSLCGRRHRPRAPSSSPEAF